MSASLSVKTCVIGSQGVGKTSLIYQLSMKTFKFNVAPTIGASFSCKIIEVDGHTVRFQIWDTAGQETFKSMLPMYYRKANLAMVVFDITVYETFRQIPKWIEELEKTADKDCIICLIGNKSDLDLKRTVVREKAEKFAQSIGALYFETSAKTNTGISEAFVTSARQLINLYHQTGHFEVKQFPSALDVQNENEIKKKSFCCF